MAITTIDASNPYLQRYGHLTVSAELSEALNAEQQNGYMVGRDVFNGVPVPAAGDNLLEFLSLLTFSGQSQRAADIGEMNGIPTADLTALMNQIDAATASTPGWVLQAISKVGNTVAENPWLLIAAPLAVYAASALIAQGAGASAGAAASAAGDTALTGGTVAAGGGAAAGSSAAWGVTGGIETLTVTAAAPALITPGLAAAATGTVAAALASTELPAAVAAGEVPPPPSSTVGSVFTNWAVDTGMGLLTQQVGEALTAKQRKEAEDAMRAAVAQQQNLVGNIPLNYAGISPELEAAAQAANKRNQLLLLAAVGAVGAFMLLGE